MILDTPSVPSQPSITQGRIYIVLAALLWSTSGAFTKLLTQPTFLSLNCPTLPSLQIAFFRVLFAGLVLLPTMRPRDFSFRPLMVVMIVCFASMNALFISAQAMGPAANAILLQYTAPMWMYLASLWWLGESADRRSTWALVLGLVGIVVIIWGGGKGDQLPVIALALGSGVAFAGVMICLRVLREASPRWLTVLNHLGSALVLAAFLWFQVPRFPSTAQVCLLILFGATQMALPYWLVARGMRVISPQEAGTITLLEPILNPLWAFLVSPGTETPRPATWIGGAVILGALAWRYWPGVQGISFRPQEIPGKDALAVPEDHEP